MVIISIITIFFLVLSVVGDKLGLRFFVGEDCKWWFRRLVFFFPIFLGVFFSCILGLGWRFKGGLNKGLKTGFLRVEVFERFNLDYGEWQNLSRFNRSPNPLMPALTLNVDWRN